MYSLPILSLPQLISASETTITLHRTMKAFYIPPWRKAIAYIVFLSQMLTSCGFEHTNPVPVASPTSAASALEAPSQDHSTCATSLGTCAMPTTPLKDMPPTGPPAISGIQVMPGSETETVQLSPMIQADKADDEETVIDPASTARSSKEEIHSSDSPSSTSRPRVTIHPQPEIELNLHSPGFASRTGCFAAACTYFGFCTDLQSYPRHAITTLYTAAQEGHTTTIQALLNAGTDLEARDGRKNTPLHVAAANGHTAVIHILISARVDPETRQGNQCTPLHLAVANGRTAAIQALLSARAATEARDKWALTPLHEAARTGRTEAIQTLLTAGAKLEARDQAQSTPLHKATESGHATAIQTFLSARALLETQNQWQYSPLHKAAESGHKKAIQTLLSAGAQLEARDLWQHSPAAVIRIRAYNSYTSIAQRKGAAGG